MSMCVCSWFHYIHWPSPDPGFMTLDSPASRCMRNKFLFSQNCPVCTVLLYSLKNKWTDQHIIKLQICKPVSFDSCSFFSATLFLHTFLTTDHQWIDSSLAEILINYLPRKFAVTLWIKRGKKSPFCWILMDGFYFLLCITQKEHVSSGWKTAPIILHLEHLQSWSWSLGQGNHSCEALLLLLAQMLKQMEGQGSSAEKLQICKPVESERPSRHHWNA